MYIDKIEAEGMSSNSSYNNGISSSSDIAVNEEGALGDAGAAFGLSHEDGIPSLSGMTVYDVETLVVLRGSEAGVLYRTSTGVVLITTRHTAGTAKPRAPLVKIFAPLGWQKPAKFYSPNYELNEEKNRTTNDIRTTLLWEPNLKTDKDGKAHISFYTADRITRFRFVLEGVANDGNYISTINITK
ncbi:MAG: hypothetical protein LBG19_04310 [Prevotellaceae bacterium]|nr:hypothetical protein [Prevotellaceae bacterium]